MDTKIMKCVTSQQTHSDKKSATFVVNEKEKNEIINSVTISYHSKSTEKERFLRNEMYDMGFSYEEIENVREEDYSQSEED